MVKTLVKTGGEEIMKEEWRDIEDYEGIYQVSSNGRIKSLEREYVHHLWKKTIYTERESSKANNNSNYPQVTLCKNGKKGQYLVHRLAEHLFQIQKTNQVNHKNG